MSPSIAFLFPGQGAQHVGMGKQLHEAFDEAKKVFDLANEILGFPLSNLCFEGPDATLTETLNAQIGIFVTSIATLRVIQKLKPTLIPAVVCGLSLGEFSALVACESLDFEEGVQLVMKRAELMTSVSQKNPGTMASILGLSLADCETILQETGVQIANINAPSQIVISGTKETVSKGCELAQKKGGKAIPLKVSGAFHSKLMNPVQEGLIQALKVTQIKEPKCAFIPNVIGEAVRHPEEIRKCLGRQVTQSVQWVKTMDTLNKMGISHAFEIGPGNVLKGLAKRNNASFSVTSIQTEDDIKQVVKTLEEKVC